MAAGLPRRLYRSRNDKMLGGVSAGLAAYFAIDPVLVRLLWVVGAVFTGGLLALAYILLWIIVPQEDNAGPPSDVVRENMNEMAAEARRVADALHPLHLHPEAFARDLLDARPPGGDPLPVRGLDLGRDRRRFERVQLERAPLDLNVVRFAEQAQTGLGHEAPRSNVIAEDHHGDWHGRIVRPRACWVKAQTAS